MQIKTILPNKSQTTRFLKEMIFFFLLAALTMSCKGNTKAIPTPTSEAESSQNNQKPASCLQGIWEIKDKERFLRAIVPVGAFEMDQLINPKVIGSIAYQFNNQGILTVEAVNFQGHFDLEIDRGLEPVEFRMNGFASARFQQDSGSIQITDMLSNDMDFSAIFSNEEMMGVVTPSGYLPLFVDAYRIAKYTCEGDLLGFTITNFPNIEGPLEFSRLR